MKIFGKSNRKGWTAKPEEKKTDDTKAIRTHNLLIVDESGSMCSIYKQALDGMNETLQTVRQAAEDYPAQQQLVTLVTFDTGHYKEHFSATPVAKTRDLTRREYSPCGGTPLFDAMGRAINELRGKLEEGDAVLVTVITDGYENASTEYSGEDIKLLVEELSKQGWLFTYIGANQDSIEFSARISIRNAMNFEASANGTQEMFAKERACRNRWFGKRMVHPDKSDRSDECDYFAD